MDKSLLWIIILSCFQLTLEAQQVPQVEVFGGYSYLRASDSLSERINQNGWDLSAAINLARSFGVVADFSNHYGSQSNVFAPIGSRGKGFAYLFGPQYSYRAAPRLTPFAHALFGGIRASRVYPNSFAGTGGLGLCGSLSCIQPVTSFAMALGGGLDVKATDRVWLRVGQVEYFRANLTNANGTSAAQNDVRISTGIVFRFGKRE
jgi:opacity protein-like surface antigen